jgi:hypothetical protein
MRMTRNDCVKRDRIRKPLFGITEVSQIERWTAMVPSLDIFRIESGDLRWCEAAVNMETAKARIKKLALSSRGSYFIFNQKSGQRIHVSVESDHGPRVGMG